MNARAAILAAAVLALILGACVGAPLASPSPPAATPVAATPAATPVAATLAPTPTPRPTLTIARVTSPAANLVVVAAADTVPQTIIDQIRAAPNIVSAEAYLLLGDAKPHPVIGLASGAPLRLVFREGSPAGRVASGRSLAAEDAGENVAVVGQVFIEDFGSSPHASPEPMVHDVLVGQTIALTPQARVRVIGRLARDAGGDRGIVILPLDTAQRLFDRGGRITHVYVTARTGADASTVARAVEDVLLRVQGR